jgi:hypothetical protein
MGGRDQVKVAIMQPYFLPYIGYWQLVNAVDRFVVYDNIEYTKRGWFNRNRFLQGGKDRLFSIAIKGDSDYLNVKDRYIAPDFDRSKLIRQFHNAYSKAMYGKEALSIVSEIVSYDSNNLFDYILNSIQVMSMHLDITTEIVISSKIDVDHSLKAEEKVLAICEAERASTYVNTIGGTALYSKERFRASGIDLEFIKSKYIEYRQFDGEFIPWLSIVDVLAFNRKDTVRRFLTEFELS